MSNKALKQTKLEALVLYFANNIPLHLGKKKLAKLLYFADFTAFELLNESITGETYIKYNYGPMPKPQRFYKILESMQDKGLITVGSQQDMFSPAAITPNAQPDISVFSTKELEIIGSVNKKFELSSASELEQIAKNEPPYKMVEFNEEIPYHLAFYRNTFGEMELEDDVVA